MNQNEANRSFYETPGPLAEDPIHAMFRELSAENKQKAIKFVETLKANQHIPEP